MLMVLFLSEIGSEVSVWLDVMAIKIREEGQVSEGHLDREQWDPHW